MKKPTKAEPVAAGRGRALKTTRYAVAVTILSAAAARSVCCVSTDGESKHLSMAFASHAAGPIDRPLNLGLEVVAESAPDPDRLLQRSIERYNRDIRDYQCVFWKQERLGERMTKPQAIEVFYRESPQSVLMKWLTNTERVSRALYIAGRYISEQGEPCALVEPAGLVARLCAGEVAIPVHGQQAREASRFTMDQFGFRATLDRLAETNRLAAARGDLEFTYQGQGDVDGRNTHVLMRHLPYGPQHPDYPDASLVIHIDQEWLLPVALFSYADPDCESLLGHYEMTKVKLNPQLNDEVFRF